MSRGRRTGPGSSWAPSTGTEQQAASRRAPSMTSASTGPAGTSGSGEQREAGSEPARTGRERGKRAGGHRVPSGRERGHRAPSTERERAPGNEHRASAGTGRRAPGAGHRLAACTEQRAGRAQEAWPLDPYEAFGRSRPHVHPARKTRVVKAPTGKQIRAEKPEVSTWTAVELAAFLRLNRHVMNDEFHALWVCIANTGMRRGEAIALRWGDIDLDAGRISIRRASDVTLRNAAKTTKTGQARVVDIDAATVEVLKSWKATRGRLALDLARASSYAFGTLENEIPNANAIGKRWSNRVRDARAALGAEKLKPLTLEGLRHTHATLLLELGIHPKVLQERLGHSNISTTMNIYSHVTPTMQRDAVSRLAALFV